MIPIQQQSDQHLQNQNSLPISFDPAYYLSLPVTPVTDPEIMIPPAFTQNVPANNELSSHSISNCDTAPYLFQSHSGINLGISEDVLLSEILGVTPSEEWTQSAENKEWTQLGGNIEGLSQCFEQPSLTYLNTNPQNQDQLQKSNHYHLESSSDQNKIPATVTDLIDSDDSVEIPLDISKLSQNRAVSSHTFTGLNQFTNAQFTPATSTYTTDLAQRYISEIDTETTGYPGNSNINIPMATKPLRRKKSGGIIDFIRTALNDHNCHYLKLINKNTGLFKITDSEAFSQAWSKARGRTENNTIPYENIARAIRHHYSTGEITHLDSQNNPLKRLHYRILNA